MKKYNLTIEQIQEIISEYFNGTFCRNNCYGCYGDDHYQTQCSWCIPKLEQYIKEKYKEKKDEN